MINTNTWRDIVKRGVLLGYSGGPDSTCLLHNLLHLRESFPFPLHLAHIDHGWREESTKEAEILEKKAQELDLPFHLLRLSSIPEKNREAFCREARYAFYKKHLGEGVLALGHHGDDQAETVLKRIFEGASLSHLSGMKKLSIHDGMPVWRPLLHVRKKEILQYLNEREIPYFQDKTNEDGSNLRSRMRLDLIPFLESTFGKQITTNICYLSEKIELINEYVREKIESIHPVKGPLGEYYDLPELNRVEAEFFLSKYVLSREERTQFGAHIIARSSDVQIKTAKGTLWLDRNYLFVLHKEPKCEWSIQPGESSGQGSWKDLWRGATSISVSKKMTELRSPISTDRCPNKKLLGKWYSENKVPVPLRWLVPVAWGEEGMLGEFLTGRGAFYPSEKQRILLSVK